MNNKTLVLGLLVMGLFTTALISRNGDVAWLTLPFLLYLGAGILQSPPAEQLRFEVTRSLHQEVADGKASVAVKLRLLNQSPAAVCLLLEETAQEGMEISSGDLRRWVELRPAEATELQYSFGAARGFFSWKALRVVVCDPLGVIETAILLPAEAAVQIRPQIKKFKSIQFRPHSTLHSPGSIPARVGGSGTDFFGVREYHAGDALRWLDWRLTARHPRKFFTKEFEQEEIAEIGLILDARNRTEVRIGGASLFEESVNATASLAEMFLHQGHRVSLFVFGESTLNVFPGYGKMQLQRILGCLSKAKVGQENRALNSLDFIPIRMFPSHAMVIILSPLTSADRSLFLRLRAHGYQALLVSPDPIDFVHPRLPEDQNGQLAVRAARIERRIRLNDIAQLQISVIDWKIRQPLFPLVRQALTRSRGQ